jgi:transcriptional regulator with XRE-family HTH domain
MTATPSPIDVHVGARVRLRRKQLRISQSALAEALGLTFQQVQKYERGANRISASKLYETATFLRTPLGFFFDGLGAPEEGGGVDGIEATDIDSLARFLMTRTGPALAGLWPDLSPPLQARVFALVVAMTDEEGGEDDGLRITGPGAFEVVLQGWA